MTAAEAEAILGPQGDHTTGPIRLGDSQIIDTTSPEIDRPAPDSPVNWAADDGCAFVFLDARGQVDFMEFDPCTRAPQGTLDNLIWRTKRRWRRWFA
jgi:hypothetical protein